MLAINFFDITFVVKCWCHPVDVIINFFDITFVVECWCHPVDVIIYFFDITFVVECWCHPVDVIINFFDITFVVEWAWNNQWKPETQQTLSSYHWKYRHFFLLFSFFFSQFNWIQFEKSWIIPQGAVLLWSSISVGDTGSLLGWAPMAQSAGLLKTWLIK